MKRWEHLNELSGTLNQCGWTFPGSNHGPGGADEHIFWELKLL